MNTPKIRFKGYTDAWEQRKLGEVFEQTSNFVMPNDDIELWSLTVEDGLTPKSERYKREFLVKKEDNFKEVRPGNIVYNPMNMTLGAVGYNGMAKSVAVSGYYTTMIAKDGYDSHYINTWLKSPQAILLYKNYATGTLIEKQRVQFPTLSTIPASFPEYKEQKQIGECFANLDNLITLHQRKCDSLNAVKKYMLQKMFPQNGAKVPEIRFKGFTGAWEQRKLSDEFSNFIVPMRDKPKEFGGNIPWTRIEDIEGKYLNGTLSDQYVTEETVKKMNLKIIPKDSLIVSSSATFGIVAVVTHDLITNQTFIGLVPNEKDTLDYWYAYFLSDEVRKYMRLQSAGSTIFYIARESFENMPISIPSKKEMISIGKYFDNLDNLITLHQRKHDELKEVKKYMLQNMFPNKQ